MGGKSYALRVRSGEAAGGPAGYELLDAGDGRRLERFGDRLVDRPAPGATARRRAPDLWPAADLRFDVGPGWTSRADVATPWQLVLADLRLELRATSSGGVGLYPEHGANLAWLTDAIRGRVGSADPPAMLNLFAHTGLATLAAARAGAAVAHVDAARSSVAWARRNATLNDLADRRVRWLVDDAEAFVEREARRGRRYAGLVLDPPSSGHARAGRWTLRDDLPRLLVACAGITAADGFVLLTAHSTGLAGEDLAGMLREAFGDRAVRTTVRRLAITAATGASLELGWAATFGGAAPARNGAP